MSRVPLQTVIRPPDGRHRFEPSRERSVVSRVVRRNLPTAVAVALAWSVGVAPPAHAGPPKIPVVEQVVQTPVVDPDTNSTDAGAFATGNGLRVWGREADAPEGKKPVIDIWWEKNGVPIKAGSLQDTSEYGFELEAGTDASGTPLVLIQTSGPGDHDLDRTTAMDLTTGKTRALPQTRSGLDVESYAVDHGNAYFTVQRRHPTSRSTAALWRAPMTGTHLGKATKIRTSKRGDQWFQVLADRGRIGIDEYTDPPRSARSYADVIDEVAFGTPRGRWRRTDLIYIAAGPHGGHQMTGFTADGKAIVVLRTQGDDDLPSLATLTPIASHGEKRQVLLGSDPDTSPSTAGFDAATGRFLTAGPAPDGTLQIGLSGIAFTP